MNQVIKSALIAIALLAVIALLIVGFQKNFEYVEKTEWQPLIGEARTNPLYASQLFLRRMGIPTKTVESLQDLTTLPGTDTAILISSSRQTLRDKQFTALVDWVNKGGHLIVAGVIDWNSYFSDSSLAAEPETETEAEAENEDAQSDEIYYDSLEEIASNLPDVDALQEFLNVELHDRIKFDGDTAKNITLKGSDRPLSLGPDYYKSIVLKGDDTVLGLEEITIDGKNVAIRQPVKNGLVTVVSNLDFIDNFNLGEYDHAEILWHIVRGKPAKTGAADLQQPNAIWLIHSDDTASLFELIWRYWWALVITLGLLFIFWILRVSRRFGPLIQKENEDRRNLLEHIDASGAYYWKQKNQQVLLQSTRLSTQQHLAKRIPGWSALPQYDQIQLLSKRVDYYSEAQLQKTLYGNIGTSAHDFTETIKQLEHIRTRL